jgi:hypothetical protein
MERQDARRATQQGAGDNATGPHREATAGTAVKVSGHQATPESVGDGLGPVSHAQFSEEPAGMRFHGVLGQIQLSPDLSIALPLAHSPQNLQFSLGELDARIGRWAGSRYGSAGQCVRERRNKFWARGIPAEVTTGTTRDRSGNAARVVRCTEDDDVGLWMSGHKPPSSLHASRYRTLRSDQDDINRLPGIAG